MFINTHVITIENPEDHKFLVPKVGGWSFDSIYILNASEITFLLF